MAKLRVGILGGTGMVGQHFVTMLANHPWFEIVAIAASEQSADRTYGEAVAGHWTIAEDIPANVVNLVVKNVMEIDAIADEIDLFSMLST